MLYQISKQISSGFADLYNFLFIKINSYILCILLAGGGEIFLKLFKESAENNTENYVNIYMFIPQKKAYKRIKINVYRKV